MVRLHLVGFTTDLKNLIFATRRGAKRGGYVVAIDRKLGGTLLEVDRLEQQAKAQSRGTQAPEPQPARASALSPKQIQALLREGKSEEQVAKLADTDVAWIRRFVSPILAERDGVIRNVRAATISKPRLGPSSLNIEEAILKNLEAKKAALEPEAFEDSWKAARRAAGWAVSFHYVSRGKRRTARFFFDQDAKKVEAANAHAFELAWTGTPVRRRKPASPSRNGKRPGASRTRSASGASARMSSNGKGRAAKAGSSRKA